MEGVELVFKYLGSTKTVARPAMMYGLETVALSMRQEAELKMLRFSLGTSRMERIRKEHKSKGRDGLDVYSGGRVDVLGKAKC